MPPISGPKSFNVPICPVLPFAARRGSRQYADGQSKPGSNCSQTASVPLREGATQCRAKHCKERPVLDRGQALGVRFFRPNETRNKPATTILIPRRQTHALPRSSPPRRAPPASVNSFSAARTSYRFWLLPHNLGQPFQLRESLLLWRAARRRPFLRGRNPRGSSGPVR